MQTTVPPEDNTRAELYENHHAEAGVVEVIARTDTDVVVERYVRDAETRSLYVYRTAWSWVYAHHDARRGVDVEGHYRKNDAREHEFSLIGDDTDVVKHDGRDWETYARERLAELMAKRFPARGGA